MTLYRNFRSKMRNLLSQGEKWSDLTIHCEDKVFHVHRAIVCAQSPYIDRLIDSVGLEPTNDITNSFGNCVEYQDSEKPGGKFRIRLAQYSEAFKHVLSFLYTGNYSGDTPASEKAFVSSEGMVRGIGIERHIDIYLCALDLQIAPLQELACARVMMWMAENCSNESAFPYYLEHFYDQGRGKRCSLLTKLVDLVAGNLDIILQNEEVVTSIRLYCGEFWKLVLERVSNALQCGQAQVGQLEGFYMTLQETFDSYS